MLGATVTFRVAREMVGLILHRLEYHPSIAIISRQKKFFGEEIFKVRGDDWPRSWDGAEIQYYLRDDTAGIHHWRVVRYM